MARAKVPRATFDYIAGGAEDEVTLRRNREAFGRWAPRPPVLSAASKRDTNPVLLGEPVSTPLCAPPTSFPPPLHPPPQLPPPRPPPPPATITTPTTT